MIALYICENLFKKIKNKEITYGRVHSVFNNACNVIANNHFVTLLSDGKPISPMSIVAKSSESVCFSDLIKESTIYFRNEKIYTKELDIITGLNEANCWYSEYTDFEKVSETRVIENIKLLESGLVQYGKFDGIVPILRVLEIEVPHIIFRSFYGVINEKELAFIKPRVVDFMKSLISIDFNRISGIAKTIIGFGPGLTPTMDDFISGLMIAYIYMGNYYNLNVPRIYDFNKLIISDTLDKTTKVSSEMLKHSAVGKTNQAIKNLIITVLSISSQEEINKSLLEVIGYGETSGTDTAVGLYVGLKIMTNEKYRKVWLNENIY